MAFSIGVWGPSAAGKTAYLSQLYLQLERSAWTVFPTAEGEEFVRRARLSIDQNRFPPATSVGTAANVSYVLKNARGGEYHLRLTDRAGKDLMELVDQTRAELNAADSLLLLMDSEADAQLLASDLDTVLSALHTARPRGTARDPRPVAICLTKADRLLKSPEDLMFARTQPDPFVRAKFGDKLAAVAARFLDRYKCFPVSAAGVFVKEDVIEPATFYDQTLLLRLASGGEPVNLLEPLAWAIEQLDEGTI